MKQAGPDLTSMIHHLQSCPHEFLMAPKTARKSGIHTGALCHDLMWSLQEESYVTREIAPFSLPKAKKKTPFLKTIQVCCWLFSFPWFRGKDDLLYPIRQFLTSGLQEIAAHVSADLLLEDRERSEELCRMALFACDLVPAGETTAQAMERLETVSTMKRKELLQATAKAHKRAMEIKRAMAEKAAREAANVYGRE